MLIVDLNDLTGQTYVNFTDFFSTAHNIIWMKMVPTYIFGTDIGNGGVIFLDVTTNPMSPSYLELGMIIIYMMEWLRGHTLWAAGCIYEGEFYEVDVSDKSNPQF